VPAQVATAPRARRLQPVQRLPPAREDQQAADAPSQGERRRELRQDAGDSSPDGDGLRRRRAAAETRGEETGGGEVRVRLARVADQAAARTEDGARGDRGGVCEEAERQAVVPQGAGVGSATAGGASAVASGSRRRTRRGVSARRRTVRAQAGHARGRETRQEAPPRRRDGRRDAWQGVRSTDDVGAGRRVRSARHAAGVRARPPTVGY